MMAANGIASAVKPLSVGDGDMEWEFSVGRLVVYLHVSTLCVDKQQQWP